AHLPTVLNEQGEKMSKRSGAKPVTQYAAEGYLPDAMVNYLTMLGWSSPDGADVFSRKQAIAGFSLERVNSSPAVFDPQKLDWMNGQYIHAMSSAELRPLVAKSFDTPWLEEGIELVKKSVHRLTEFGEALAFVRSYSPPTGIDGAFAAALADDLRGHGAPLDEEQYKAFIERLKTATGLKGKLLFMPLRLALTGLDHGPELVRTIPLLDRASRVDLAVLSPLDRAEKLPG
ncbi:MAG: glutamate--tRNA ligase family protein, partial [Acidobacteriota bacterium]